MNKNKKNSNFSSHARTILIALVFIVGGILILSRLTDYTRNIQSISYSDFLKKVESKEVQAVHVSGTDVYGILQDGTKFETVVADIPGNWELLRKNNVEFSVAGQSSQISWWHLISFAFNIGIAIFALWFFIRQSRSSGGGGGVNVFSMGKSRAKMFMPSTIKETFDSVAGATEAKEELKDVVDFLRNPEKYRRLGARITRGVLLVGEPGNGKTLLAKAVAGEANCPFFSISGSDFIEVFVGVGAARVRDLFLEARKHAPCIVFIDEIDAVGRQRGTSLGGGAHDEREQTLNQLLSEMDGFQTVGGSVIVLAATNRPDVLDKALLRPGRFDRRVEVPYPDLTCREQILRLHAKGVSISSEVDLAKIARGTPGFSGADLANLINEAAIMASKKNQDQVFPTDFEEARDKIVMGTARKTIILSPREREITAYHEGGHALVRLLLPNDTEPLHKMTILPRGFSLGATHWLPERDKHMHTEREMRASVMSALGGRAAEKLVFNELGSGAYDDFRKATALVREMVCLLGMAPEVGPIVYSDRDGGFRYSEKMAETIDQAVLRITRECEASVDTLLVENRDKLEALAKALLERETLYASEIYQILGIEPRTEHTF